MMKLRWLAVVIVLGLGLLAVVLPGKAADPPKADYDAVVDKAVAYLKKSQAEDGSWSKEKNIGITAVALTGLLESGKVKPTDPVAEKGLKYVESLVNVKEGHIAGADPK